MGQWFSALRYVEEEDVDLSSIFTELQQLESKRILDSFEKYHGCDEQIRKAISLNSDESKFECWVCLLPCVVQLRDFYHYSFALEEQILGILNVICKTPVQEKVLENQSSAKSFVDTCFFAFCFDDAKHQKSFVQNDLSYYRRTLPQLKARNIEIPVPEDEANKMTLFFAHPPGPFLKQLIQTLTKFNDQGNLQVLLSILASSCLHFSASSHSSYCLKSMATILILYDHIHPTGLFFKSSKINIRPYIKAIKASSDAPILVNALMYFTKTYSSPEVPRSIKQLFDE